MFALCKIKYIIYKMINMSTIFYDADEQEIKMVSKIVTGQRSKNVGLD